MRLSVVVSALVLGSVGVHLWRGRAGVVDEADDIEDVPTLVGRLLNEHRVVIFSKTYCGFSRRAKSILEQRLGAGGFGTVELDERDDGGDIQDHMQRLTGARTVPRVFVDGAFVGGSDELAALNASGKLATLLKSKGIA